MLDNLRHHLFIQEVLIFFGANNTTENNFFLLNLQQI